MRTADAADLCGDPRGAELLLQGGRRGLHGDLLEVVFAAVRDRLGTGDPLGWLAGDRCHGQRFATGSPSWSLPASGLPERVDPPDEARVPSWGGAGRPGADNGRAVERVAAGCGVPLGVPRVRSSRRPPIAPITPIASAGRKIVVPEPSVIFGRASRYLMPRRYIAA